MPTHNNILFIINMRCSYIVCWCKWFRFRLAVNDLITQQLEKNILKMITMISFHCHYWYICGVDAILI